MPGWYYLIAFTLLILLLAFWVAYPIIQYMEGTLEDTTRSPTREFEIFPSDRR